jgi:predicted transcriptional regulator
MKSTTQRSKLEVCLTILELLTKGPQTLSNIDASTKTKADITRECLHLLKQQKLLEESINHNNVLLYSNTERGNRVLAFFYNRIGLH